MIDLLCARGEGAGVERRIEGEESATTENASQLLQELVMVVDHVNRMAHDHAADNPLLERENVS